MAITTTTTIANILKTVYEPRLADLVFSNNYLFKLPGASPDPMVKEPQGLFPMAPSKGGTTYNWPVKQATTAAAAYTEGQAAPAPGNNTYLNASLAYSAGYFWRGLELTGHVEDAATSEAAILDALDREVTSAVNAIEDLINTTFLGTSHLQLAIDSAGTYAGINRSTYSNWGSYEAAISGAQTLASMRDAVEALKDNNRGARIQDLAILMPVNQMTNHSALVGAGAGVPHVVQASGGVFDLGFTGATFQGIPIYEIPDMTDTVILFVHKPSVHWVMHRPLQFEYKAQQGDSKAWLLTCALQLVVERPDLCGKLTAVTA